jgi:hypothetical protein
MRFMTITLLLMLTACSYLGTVPKQTADSICADVPYQRGFVLEYYGKDAYPRRFSIEQREHFERLWTLCPKDAEKEKTGRIVGAWLGQVPYTLQAGGADFKSLLAQIPPWALPFVTP